MQIAEIYPNSRQIRHGIAKPRADRKKARQQIQYVMLRFAYRTQHLNYWMLKNYYYRVSVLSYVAQIAFAVYPFVQTRLQKYNGEKG